MIKINMNHLNKFKVLNNRYVYPISKGIYLSFDKNSLEYMDIIEYYIPKFDSYRKGNELLEKLYYFGLLEIN